MRFVVYILTVILFLLFCALGLIDPVFFWPALLAAPLALLGSWDLYQQNHNLLRNYPIVGHLRWLIEAIRPQVHQYLIESDTDGRPFNREERSVVYQRAKNVVDKIPFGTELDVYANEYEWLNHSIAPTPEAEELFRIRIGGVQCSRQYSASVLNISAMSFGALGADWCNAARGFMFALGCVQSQKCHTDRCPTGVATQDPRRQRALVIEDKAQRVRQFHYHTVRALGAVIAAAGLNHPSELQPRYLYRRIDSSEVQSAAHGYTFLEPDALLGHTVHPEYREDWEKADPRFFTAK